VRSLALADCLDVIACNAEMIMRPVLKVYPENSGGAGFTVCETRPIIQNQCPRSLGGRGRGALCVFYELLIRSLCSFGCDVI
jgi:hypothetical protein